MWHDQHIINKRGRQNQSSTKSHRQLNHLLLGCAGSWGTSFRTMYATKRFATCLPSCPVLANAYDFIIASSAHRSRPCEIARSSQYLEKLCRCLLTLSGLGVYVCKGYCSVDAHKSSIRSHRSTCTMLSVVLPVMFTMHAKSTCVSSTA